VAGPLGVQLVAWLFEPATGFAALFYVLAGLAVLVMLVALALPSERREPVAA